MSINFYKILSYLSWPIAAFILAKRKEKGKEDLVRFPERLGIASKKRPKGKLIWFHGASVGETRAMFPLIKIIKAKYPKYNFLVTSGTRAAADMMAKHKDIIHQYVPVDFSLYVRNFLDHWKPDLSIRMESDFWPVLTKMTKEFGIKIVLVNGKITDGSYKKYKKILNYIAPVLAHFDKIYAKSLEDAAKFKVLGAQNVLHVGNIKYSSDPLKYDREEYKKLASVIAGKKVFCAASTHEGEEEIILKLHQDMRKEIKNYFTIIAPRHPGRGDEIAQLIDSLGLKYNQRSKGQALSKNIDIYLADTMGELGLFFMLSDLVLIGGSLKPIKGIGGHNPMEPALLDRAIISGKYIEHWEAVYKEMEKAGGTVIVDDYSDLKSTVYKLLSDENKLAKMTKKGKDFSVAKRGAADRIFHGIKKYLDGI
jgi:3-deoxy-D-manno-octulosonic-acid transferase